MAKKVALLVGVSNYQQGLSALPSVTKNVKALKQVLQHPDIGGFVETDITSLLVANCKHKYLKLQTSKI